MWHLTVPENAVRAVGSPREPHWLWARAEGTGLGSVLGWV